MKDYFFINNSLLLVNKNNKLSDNYVPNDLVIIHKNYSSKDIYLKKIVKEQFEKMAIEAKKLDLNLIAVSGYRSFDYQKDLFNYYVKEKGYEYASKCSAQPGYSEHQTGLAVDIADNSLDYDNFEDTKEFNWIRENAHKFGFILRYPKDKVDITGYKYEPWHFRYVGKKVAKYIYENNLALEEISI